jgi:hypothetical protein
MGLVTHRKTTKVLPPRQPPLDLPTSLEIKLACLVLLALHFAVFAQETPKEPRLKPIYENGRWGDADRSGKVIIAAQFDAARPFADGLAQVGVVDEELPEASGRPNLKWGYLGLCRKTYFSRYLQRMR